MTQDVQPLTWQKRTNIEEHQQFFSKINEIIDNLAPTVEEAEAAIAQATQAVATANAASAAASAAASQAQTAASTVAGYDIRLTAAEDSIDTQGQQITVLQGRAGALETGMTALGTRMTAAESKNSQQDTDIAALQTADAQNVKIDRINEYAVGLTGNQRWTGVKTANATFSHGVTSADMMTNPESFIASTVETYIDQMNADTHNSLGSITRVRNQTGQNYLDLLSTSYGYFENDVQIRIDVFIRLLINDVTGESSLIFYRSRRNADGSGTSDVKAKVLATITAAGVIS